MKTLKRRRFLGLSGSALAAMHYPGNMAYGRIRKEKTPVATPMIHVTDLYRPHEDPDDHWDLASVYALAYSGNIDLQGILIDFPPEKTYGDPDMMGIAQMNYLTGLVVPATTGAHYIMKNKNDIPPTDNKIEYQGVNRIIETLKKSPFPVVINILGASTDIAIASKREPELFKNKCKAIYQNAGCAYTTRENKTDYNVHLNPSAYAAVFDAPCPVYWLPVFHERTKFEVGEYGSYYHFLQKDILPYLSKRLQNYFLYMFEKKAGPKWLAYLNGEPDQELIARYGSMQRNMWCTAGFFHAAGKKITPEGEIVSARSTKDSLFSFKPVKMTCDDSGYTSWAPGNQSKKRYILHINDTKNYQKAMTTALKNLLLQLP